MLNKIGPCSNKNHCVEVARQSEFKVEGFIRLRRGRIYLTNRSLESKDISFFLLCEARKYFGENVSLWRQRFRLYFQVIAFRYKPRRFVRVLINNRGETARRNLEL